MKLCILKSMNVRGLHLAENLEISSCRYNTWHLTLWLQFNRLGLAGVGSRLDLSPRNLALETSL